MDNKNKKIMWEFFKRLVLGIGFLLLVFMIAIFVFIFCWSPFGSSPSKETMKAYEARTEYFYDGKFHTKDPFVLNTEVIGEPSEDSAEKVAKDGEIPVKKIVSFPNTKNGEWDVTWFGHSTVMLQIDGKKIFIDPVLSEYSSPVQFGIGKRMSELPMTKEEIPYVDVVLLSHDHYDHLDYETIIAIDAKVGAYVVPLGVEQHLIRWGVAENKIHTFAWWESNEVVGLSFTAIPGRHFSGRLPWTLYQSLWCGFVIKTESQQIYYTGDTGYGDMFQEVYDKFGKMDLMIVENGQYNKAWSQCHMMPEEAVQAALDVKADVVLPVHWATFVLAKHKWSEPAERITKEAQKKGVKIITPIIGQTVNKNDIAQYMTPWWNLTHDRDVKQDTFISNTVKEELEEEKVEQLDNNEMNISKISVTVDSQKFVATLEQNQATTELVTMLKKGPKTIKLKDYSGFEKVGSLGVSLTTSNSQVSTIPGDIVLYNGNQLVLFSGTNTWSYTKIAHIENLTGWQEALGNGDVTVTLSLE